MKIYNVGVDELSEWDYRDIEAQSDKFEWFVYFYESGSWEGSGEAVAIHKDGKLHYFNLSHCSCYGPMDGWPSGGYVQTVEQFFDLKDNVLDYDYKDVVKNKVAELLGLK